MIMPVREGGREAEEVDCTANGRVCLSVAAVQCSAFASSENVSGLLLVTSAEIRYRRNDVTESPPRPSQLCPSVQVGSNVGVWRELN